MTVNAGRKATLVLVSNLAGAVLGYVGLLLIGRYFEPSAYGSYLFALSVTGLVAVVSNLGIGTAHQRHLAQGLEAGKGLGILVRLRLLIGLPVLTVALLAYFVWSAARPHALTDATTPSVLLLALAIQLQSGARQTLFDTWQGQQRVHRIETVRTLDTALAVLLLGNAALLVAHLQGRWEVLPGIGAFWAGVLGFETAPGIAQGALLLGSCYFIAKAVSLLIAMAWGLRDRLKIGPWDPTLARSYVRFAIPFAMAGTLGLVLQYTDALMLGFFWTAREVGLYGTAQKLAVLCLLSAGAVGTVLFPRFAQLHAAGDEAGMAKTHRRSERWLMILVVPVVAAMVSLPSEGIHIAVGDGYLEAAAPLQFLALWALVAATELPLSSRLMAGGHANLMLRAAGLNAGLNVLFNLALIPRGGLGLGPAGAALATLASTFVSYLYVRAKGRRLYHLPWVAWHQVRILLAGASAAAFWVVARGITGPTAFDRAWELGLWGLAGGLLYFLVLGLVRELHARDLEFLRKVAHPRELLSELRGH